MSIFQLKTAREVAQFGVVGSIVGGITTAGWAWKYSKSPHGKFYPPGDVLIHYSIFEFLSIDHENCFTLIGRKRSSKLRKNKHL